MAAKSLKKIYVGEICFIILASYHLISGEICCPPVIAENVHLHIWILLALLGFIFQE